LNHVGRCYPWSASGRRGSPLGPLPAAPLSFCRDQFGLICPQCVLDRLQHRPQLGALGVRLDEVDHPPKYRPLVGIQIARCPLLNAKTSRRQQPVGDLRQLAGVRCRETLQVTPCSSQTTARSASSCSDTPNDLQPTTHRRQHCRFPSIDTWRLKGALGAGRTSPSSFTGTHSLISHE
jgi:hypothetical protein